MNAPEALLADRYRLERVLGSGGMGLVWEAWDERLHRKVAVKQLRPQPGLSEAETALANQRAMREARINARLHHRYAVPVFDAVEHDGQPCLIMQFVPSVPLSAVLGEGGPLAPAEAAQLGAQIGSALAAAHQAGIVHRDVKPGNILIADDGTALISDFGISHAMGDATLTETGMVHGTPAYLSPEVARGGDATFASDVFSLGATLYAALEGTPPFGKDQNSLILLHRVAAGTYDPPRNSGPLTPLLTAMLSADPADRPSMSTVAQSLTQLSTVPAAGPAAVTGAGCPDRAGGASPVTEGSIHTVVRRSDPAADEPTQVQPTPPVIVAPPPGPGSVDDGGTPPRRRRGGVVVLALLLVAAVVAGAVLLGRGLGERGVTGADPATTPSVSASADESSPSSPATETSAASPSEAASTTSAPTPTPTPTAASTRTAEPTRTKEPPVSSRPTDAQLARAIRDYYALLPDQTDEAWPLLTRSFQRGTAGGRGSFDGFWGLVRQVSASDVTGSAPDTAEAVITYRYKDGRVVRERTSFAMVNDDGVLKINGTTLLGGG